MPIIIPPPPATVVAGATLIVEDGTGKPDAESYCSVAFADDYHWRRGNEGWDTLPTSQKEQLLRKATDFMGDAYRRKWSGARVNQTQKLDWPRAYVPRGDQYQYTSYYYEQTDMPTEVKEACAKLAFKALSGDLWGDTDATTTTVAGAVTKEKLGPLEVTYSDGGSTVSISIRRFPDVEGQLASLFKQFGMVRA